MQQLIKLMQQYIMFLNAVTLTQEPVIAIKQQPATMNATKSTNKPIYFFIKT